MEAKFTRGPYQREGRSIYKLVDNPEPRRGFPGQINLWLAGVSPCGIAVDTAELEAVATLFQASPLLYEALKQQLAQWQLISNMVEDDEAIAATIEASMQLINNALRAARGEK